IDLVGDRSDEGKLDIDDVLCEIGSVVPENLKFLNLGSKAWTYTKDSISEFLDQCETRLKRKPCTFIM
ncbi:8671_t:CDS:1, partial [Racocetra fulgida]